ncbi:MAG: aspartate aminotransferase family protein [Flavobacteriales bacterium]|nr:aspartate aminotransferase family protein [Flavobacteriales bacterium]
MSNIHLAQTSQTPFEIDVDYADGIYIYDKEGKRYADLISGISVSNLGHNNRRIKKAIQDQVDKYLHVMVYGEYKQNPQQNLANLLAEVLPEQLNSTFFVNSGTEANEAALKLAKRVTGRTEIVSCHRSYHGSTHGALSVTGNEQKKYHVRPLLPGVSFMEFNNEADLSLITDQTAAVIIEPIQGDAGVRIPSLSYMKALRKKCDETGAMLIFDEIQTGFGRTGKLFAFEHFDIVPDILTIAKAMGGGMPIGAFISAHKNMHELTYNPNLGHITTFGGHPVCCASAYENLRILTEGTLIDEVEEKGHLFETIIQHPSIIEIRRKGLFFAIEMDHPDTVQDIVLGCREKGVLSYWFLSNAESFRIAPPLTITLEEVRKTAAIIHEVIDTVSQKSK